MVPEFETAVYRSASAYCTRAKPCVRPINVWLYTDLLANRFAWFCILLYWCCPVWQPFIGSIDCACSGLTATVINEYCILYIAFHVTIATVAMLSVVRYGRGWSLLPVACLIETLLFTTFTESRTMFPLFFYFPILVRTFCIKSSAKNILYVSACCDQNFVFCLQNSAGPAYLIRSGELYEVKFHGMRYNAAMTSSSHSFIKYSFPFHW